ncbi:related to TR4 orphan receptor associated protein TRA16 [Sporisorium reilianum f. sp. reilianum]|uniref:Related to TR4 orphan receptor associated protein TRA16 n=1 Tax=Sporisorium reilianum f. sp. reilianum TaxID=72559 RepID=A0A2N8UD96_9BASI|nr:related to TR4 orphan receptor associated protein TRA16 [Sporisorium reilianum f. sp. reilianum]
MTAAPTLIAPTPPADKTLRNVLTADVKVKVSSGTTKDAKCMLDGTPETCWTSDSLAPNSDPSSAHYLLSFKLAHPLALSELHSLALTFAGGFSPTSLSILASETDGKTWFPLATDLFPNDTNAKQYFDLSALARGADAQHASWLRFELTGSTDDYGRVTIYQAEVFAAVGS